MTQSVRGAAVQDCVEKGLISAAQLETMVYAGMRFQHRLPGGARPWLEGPCQLCTLEQRMLYICDVFDDMHHCNSCPYIR